MIAPIVPETVDSNLPSLREFEEEAKAFLNSHAERLPDDATVLWGMGSDDVAVFEELDPEAEQMQLKLAREWRAKRFDAGWGYISGLPEYGGRGLPTTYSEIYDSIEAQYAVPKQDLLGVGLG